jgi:hypothetical protein
MDFLTLNLPKSRRGLLLSLANSKISTASEGRNPPSIVTDHDGIRLFGRDLQRTQGEDNVSPTHNSEGMRSTIQKSKICTYGLPSPTSGGINAWTMNRPCSIREHQASDHNLKSSGQEICSAERDFVTSMQSTVSGVGRTNRVFGAVPSRNDQAYRLRSKKYLSEVPNVVMQHAEAVDESRSPSTPNTKPRSRGGENRVMFSSQGRWSTFFSEEDLQKPLLPDGNLTAGITDPTLQDDHTGNASPKSRSSSTFESDGIRTTLHWRSRGLAHPRRLIDARARARGPASPSDSRCPSLPAHPSRESRRPPRC